MIYNKIRFTYKHEKCKSNKSNLSNITLALKICNCSVLFNAIMYYSPTGSAANETYPEAMTPRLQHNHTPETIALPQTDVGGNDRINCTTTLLSSTSKVHRL